MQPIKKPEETSAEKATQVTVGSIAVIILALGFWLLGMTVKIIGGLIFSILGLWILAGVIIIEVGRKK